MVDSLVSMCLLRRDKGGGLMMHDVVRDVAVSISSEEGQGFVLKVISPLSQWSDIGLDNCKRLSLILKPGHFDSSEIQPRLPQLVTLSLSGRGLKEIHPEFFQEMKNILTLDLSDTDIRSLPPSLSFLVNLRTLRLERCYSFRSLSPIEKLEKLEILVLNETINLEFPKEIRGLSNLRLLDLSKSDWQVGLSPEVISSLSRLEQLYMNNGYGDGDGDGYDSILSAIGSLNRLTHLELDLDWSLNESLSERLSTDWERLSPEMIHRWKNLKKFQLVINCNSDPFYFNQIVEDTTADRCFALALVSFPIVNNFVKVMMCMATFLELWDCRGLKNVVQEVDQSVKLFGMEGCPEMQYLISNLQELRLSLMDDLVAICDGNGTPLQGFFNKLRVLTIFGCPQLIKLTSSPTFSNIRRITIEHCPSVKNLFPITVVRHLLHLEEIYIEKCKGLKIIIADDSSDQGSGINADKDKAILPRLTRLTVIDCEQLHSFCPPGLLVNWPSLNELKVDGCPNLKRLPFGTDSVPKLASLDVDREWFNELEWNDESIKSRLQLLIVDKGVRDDSDDNDDSD